MRIASLGKREHSDLQKRPAEHEAEVRAFEVAKTKRSHTMRTEGSRGEQVSFIL